LLGCAHREKNTESIPKSREHPQEQREHPQREDPQQQREDPQQQREDPQQQREQSTAKRNLKINNKSAEGIYSPQWRRAVLSWIVTSEVGSPTDFCIAVCGFAGFARPLGL
jgi:hypothetical protein